MTKIIMLDDSVVVHSIHTCDLAKARGVASELMLLESESSIPTEVAFEGEEDVLFELAMLLEEYGWEVE